MENLFPTLQYFSSFFHLVSKLFKGLFQSLCWSVYCMSLVFKLYNIFWRYPEAQALIYTGALVALLFMERSVHTDCNFFLACKMYYLVCKYTLNFGSAKRHKRCLYWSLYSTDIYRKIIFNRLLLF